MTAERRKRPVFMDEGEIRGGLEAELMLEVNEAIWEDLVEEGHVGRVLAGELGIDELANKYRRKLERFGHKAKGNGEKAPRTVPPDRRSHALADILAIDAGRMEEVAAFRRDVLGGNLLRWEDVPAWIESAAEKDGRPTLWVRVPLPDSVQQRGEQGLGDWLAGALRAAADAYAGKRAPPVSMELDFLSYSAPGFEYAKSIPIRRDGILGRLKRIAVMLTRRYPWKEAQATVFVLTGLPPALPKATVTHAMWELEWPPRYPALRRVTLDVDLRLSPKEVADIYARVRSEHFEGRDKPLGDKPLALAVFAHEHKDTLTWEQMFELWNREHPEWAYSAREFLNFSRDARAAWQRVTGAPWPRKQVPGEDQPGEEGTQNGGK